MIKDCTFVSGFWVVPNNHKRDREHYLHLLPRTLALIPGQKLVFFYNDPEFFAVAADSARRNNVEMVGQRLEIEELPNSTASETLLTSCAKMDEALLVTLEAMRGEKAARHYFRDYKQSGEETYKALMAVWTSKVPLVAELAASKNVFKTENFAWMDISISRFKGRRKNWHFPTLIYPAERGIFHYPSKMRYRGQKMRMSASFLYGSAASWIQLNSMFRTALQNHKFDNYAHDEETILNLIATNYPTFFRELSGLRLDWTGALFPFLGQYSQVVASRLESLAGAARSLGFTCKARRGPCGERLLER